MFEKISLITAILLIMMFTSVFYYERGVPLPRECILLHDDYVQLTELINDPKNTHIITQFFTQDEINDIQNINAYYDQMMNKNFKRTGLDTLKFSCEKAQKSLNLKKTLDSFKRKQENPQEIITYQKINPNI